MAMAEPNEDRHLRERPIGELLRELSQETTTLVRKELDLAKAEMAEKGRQAGRGAGMFGGAGAVGYLGLAALTAAAVAGLATGMQTWLAALIVAVVWLAIAGLMGLAARNRVKAASPPVPEQSIESVKEDVQWARTRASSAQR
jgi:Putative Actinobacterial Holin-X, holin superfamily III